MTTRRLLLMAIALLLAQLSFTTNGFGQTGRLSDLSSRLASEADAFAETSYRGNTGVFRDNRNNVRSAMLAHHFNGGVRLFNRMVNDRMRRNDLREAFQVLQGAASSVDNTNSQAARWSTIQRLMSDISSELSYNRGDDRDEDDSGSRSGRITWRGRVDDDVRVVIRGGQADVQTIGGNPYYDASTNFGASLPRRRVNVRVEKRRGRGEIFVEQQPSRENDYSAVIRIRDPRGGASDYEFDVIW